jgi:tetratricopeptide (TPR) repeat protein
MKRHRILALLVFISGFSPPESLAQDLPQQEIQQAAPAVNSVNELPLSHEKRSALQDALNRKDYSRAETLLVAEIEARPKSPELLKLLGGIFFLDGRYLNSAIAFKKAEALAPLTEADRFTLAMSYIVLKRSEWARPELEKLRDSNPKAPLYLYWLARLDYDAQHFNSAVDKLQEVLKLNPNFMKAYDNLALCFEALGNQEEAIRTYEKAILLNRGSSSPSPWPPLNLGSLFSRLGRLAEAEQYLKESLECDSKLQQAHYQRGVVLEKQGRNREAIEFLLNATELDPAYPEPYYALGRVYRRLGEREKAEEALLKFESLKKEKRSGSATDREESR